MPTVAVVDGVKIQFFFGDHLPMHFHVECAGDRAQIDLATLELLEGRLSAGKLDAVRRWAQARREELRKCWDKANAYENPGKVE